MTDHDAGGVRITNQRIYDLLVETKALASSLKQSVDETLKPSIATNTAAIQSLKENKADKAETAALRGSIDSVRIQTYAIGSGVLAGLIALRTLGVI